MADTPVPVRAAYFCKTRWGAHAEFVELFTRNHLPILREELTAAGSSTFEDGDRKREPDAHQVREVHQRPDGRQPALLRQAPQECLGRRAVLRRLDAEAAEQLAPTPAPPRRRERPRRTPRASHRTWPSS